MRRQRSGGHGEQGHHQEGRQEDLAEAVAKLGRWDTPVRLNETTRAYFQRMAEISEGEAAFRYANIENPEYQQEISDWFRVNDPLLYSNLRTSVVPTILDALVDESGAPRHLTAPDPGRGSCSARPRAATSRSPRSCSAGSAG